MSPTPTRIDQALTMLVLAVLIGGCFLVLRPFVTAVLWAVVLSVATWPLYLRARALLQGRRSIAAAVMALLIAVVFLTPFVVAGISLADNSDRVAQAVRDFAAAGPPDLPAWIASLPLIGERIQSYWSSVAHDTAQLVDEARKLIEPAKTALLAGGASLAQGVLQIALSILIVFFLFRDGDAAVLRLRAAMARIAPRRGMRLVELAAATMRGVVYGILGTALAQGVLMAIGLYVAGIRAAPLLGLVTFFLSPVPVGPPLVWVPAGIWLIIDGHTGWGIFVLLWGALVVSMVDNLLRPFIISRSGNLSFILVLLGILGGVVAFGFIGVFLGPVLLALGLALLTEWAEIAEEETTGS